MKIFDVKQFETAGKKKEHQSKNLNVRVLHPEHDFQSIRNLSLDQNYTKKVNFGTQSDSPGSKKKFA
jgi:hypothetical protein